MDPATYLLLEGVAFVTPNDPGPTPVYPQWAAPTTIKMINATFMREKNFFLSFKNTAQSCFCMFNENVGAQFKVSNSPTLTGWNSMMTIIKILNQFQDFYGKPNIMTLYDTLFRSAMTPGDLSKMLFYGIEQCQEIQRIGKIPYFNDQIFVIAVRILVQLNIFPLKEFDTWEAIAAKTYPALKMFIQEAYGQQLAAIKLRNTSGQNGYSLDQNIYNILDGADDKDNNTVTTVTQAAAAATTTGSTTTTTTIVIPPDIAAAINHLSSNQTAIMSQMAAMSFAPAPTQTTQSFMPRKPFQVPPIQQIVMPAQQQPFHMGAFDARPTMERGGGGHRCGQMGQGG
jgi:hypothetical protein